MDLFDKSQTCYGSLILGAILDLLVQLKHLLLDRLDFCKLFREEQKWFIKYMELLYTYDEITVGNRRFHLSHTLSEYDEKRGIHDVSLMEFVWGEPDYDKCYDPDVTFITGHTPTGLIDPEYHGKIWQGNGHIAIDCGAAHGGRLGCICLDTMEEFYV